MDVLHSTPESLNGSLKDGKITVAVYGLGHVGLSIATVWLRAGARVIGVDVREDIVRSIGDGVSSIQDEPVIPEVISKSVAEAKLRTTLDGVKASRESDVKIIAVPTTLSKEKNCDIAALKQVLQVIAGGLKKGDLVIIESSVPPTTTIKVAQPALEKGSSLGAEEDFGLAYSPERVLEGRAIEDIETRYPKVVGGLGPKSTQAAAALYEVIARQGVIRVSSPTVAETEKLVEGIYRDVNIALANELASFCGPIGIDFTEVREAANSQPFCHLHYPGFVGGWCIPFYPYFMMQVASEKKVELELTRLARNINEKKPQLLVKVADSMLKEVRTGGLKGSKVAILGLTFRGDIADTRNSPSYEVIELLLRRGVKTISAHDPYVTGDAGFIARGVKLAASINEALTGADLAMIMTDHSIFKIQSKQNEILEAISAQAILIDGRSVLSTGDSNVAAKGFVLRRVEGFNIFIRSK
jgi:nucleotide sugar dehydrogenase